MTGPAPLPVLVVVGLGCIGGSIALRARTLGFHVAGFDLPAPLELAQSLGVIDESLTAFDGTVACAVLVLATPPAIAREYLEALAAVRVGAELVIDVASVKTEIARTGAAIDVFVPTHPIAGSEQSGPRAATASLFEGRPWAIVPQGSTTARDRALSFVKALGAVPVEIGAADHDRIVASTSHVPQLLAVALGDEISTVLDDPMAIKLVGSGLSSMVRLGGSSWEMWRDVLAANREPIASDLRSIAAILTGMAERLETGKTSELEDAFSRAAAVAARVSAPNASRSERVA